MSTIPVNRESFACSIVFIPRLPLAFTEYIIECLNLLKYRIGQLTNDLRKQFMNNFLPVSERDGEESVRKDP